MVFWWVVAQGQSTGFDFCQLPAFDFPPFLAHFQLSVVVQWSYLSGHTSVVEHWQLKPGAMGFILSGCWGYDWGGGYV